MVRDQLPESIDVIRSTLYSSHGGKLPTLVQELTLSKRLRSCKTIIFNIFNWKLLTYMYIWLFLRQASALLFNSGLKFKVAIFETRNIPLSVLTLSGTIMNKLDVEVLKKQRIKGRTILVIPVKSQRWNSLLARRHTVRYSYCIIS